MARLSLILSLLSLALLASAANHDVARSERRGRHGKRCKPASSSSTPTSTWTPPPPTTTSSSSPTWYPPPSSSSDDPNDDAWTPTTSSPAWTPTSSTSDPPAQTSSAPPPSTVSTGGNKCGAGWPNGDDGTILNVVGECTWYHTWSVYPVNTGGKLNFAAVFWGPDQVSDWSANILNSGAEVAMFFNEPQETGQSNIDPVSAVPYWQNNFQYLKDQYGYRLGSAATSSNPNGIDWTNQFIQACGSSCTIDFMCLHWYGTTVSDFQTYVQLWYSTYNLPIWITEFACQNFVNLDQQCTDIPDFMSQAVGWLDSQDFVEFHAWFGFMRDMQNVNPADGLMNQDGTLNALGYQYVYST